MPTQNRNTSVSLKQKLHGHTATIGSWFQLGHVEVAEIMALAGFDWLVVDLEHSVISIETAADLIRLIDSCGVVPLVRLTSNDPNQIKRVMDAGAHGTYQNTRAKPNLTTNCSPPPTIAFGSTTAFVRRSQRLDARNKRKMHNAYNPELADHTTHHTTPAPDPHQSTLRRLCHLYNAGLPLAILSSRRRWYSMPIRSWSKALILPMTRDYRWSQ